MAYVVIRISMKCRFPCSEEEINDSGEEDVGDEDVEEEVGEQEVEEEEVVEEDDREHDDNTTTRLYSPSTHADADKVKKINNFSVSTSLELK